MCGRTACTMAPDEICRACSTLTFTPSGKKQYKALEWRDHPGNHTYTASHNIPPSRFTPVIVSNHHFQGMKRNSDDEEKTWGPQYVIQPMRWGLIPHFYEGPSPDSHKYKTNNCRLEEIDEKPSYQPSLLRGQRCVVLCDGFYEWESTKGDRHKQPYFIYAPQPEGVEIWNPKTWEKEDLWSEEEGWKGPRLLKMAGLFARWTSTEGEEVMSYTIITMSSGKEFASLHSRVPAILETDKDVDDWLNNGTVGSKVAISKLKRDTELTWHPVSPNVNHSRNQDSDLNHPLSSEKLSELQSKEPRAPWWNEKCQASKRERNRAQHALFKYPSDENRLYFKRMRGIHQKITKDTKQAYYESLESNTEGTQV